MFGLQWPESCLSSKWYPPLCFASFLCVCTCVCRSQCVGSELPCPFLLTLRESHGAHFNSERQACINNSFPLCLPYFCMWYKCYSQSAGEGFGEMQEGYKESKNRGWQSLFRSSCFTLSLYSFSPFSRSICTLFCLHIVFVPHIIIVQIVFSGAKSDQTLKYFDKRNHQSLTTSERFRNPNFEECEMPS